MKVPVRVSVIIPTYRREQVLLDTLDQLRALEPVPAEILVLDQTEQHEPEVQKRLQELNETRNIRWIRLPAPSIPAAMNRGLIEAKNSIVLFVDDDIVPDTGLVSAHYAADASQQGRLVAGRVFQPWDIGSGGKPVPGSGFTSSEPCEMAEFMGGNFSVPRERAIALGGFDENFVGVAYRFEREFADRWLDAGYKIRYEPEAIIRHLKATEGGTRSFGDHLRTALPHHAVGEYYYLWRTRRQSKRFRAMFRRLAGAVFTKHHLTRPWWIPATLVAEMTGFVWATLLALKEPKLIENRDS